MLLKNKNGFTLIEVMISLLITSIVVMMVYSTYRACVNAYEHGKDRGYLYQDVKIVLEYLQRDIHSAFVTSTNRNLVFIGRDIKDEEIQTDSLEITTSSSFGLDKDMGKFPLRRVKYSLINNDKNHDPGLQRIVFNGNSEKEYSREILGPLVRELKFRYYDGARWKDSWGIHKKTGKLFKRGFVLPKAVEVTLTFEDRDNPSGQLVICKVIPVMAEYPAFHE